MDQDWENYRTLRNWLLNVIPESGSEFWPIFIATVVGAIVGAVVGGIISWRIQVYVLRAEQARADRERHEQDKTLALSLLLKLVNIYSNVKTIDTHLTNCLYANRNTGSELWQTYMPMANFAEKILFEIQEKTLILKNSNIETFNSVMDLDIRHNGLLDAAITLNQNRIQLSQQMSAEDRGGGQMVTFLREDEKAKLRPLMTAINSLIFQLRLLSKMELEASKRGLEQFNNVIKTKFKIGMEINILS